MSRSPSWLTRPAPRNRDTGTALIAVAVMLYQAIGDGLMLLIVLGGMMDETELDSAGIAALAKMPSLDELRGKIIGVISAPATKVAGVLQAPAGQVARVIGAYGASEAA